MKLCLHQLATIFFVLMAANLSATVLYVDLNSTNPMPPYTNWITAATNIQDAVGGASPGDQVLVTDGVYRTGGHFLHGVTNRVAINEAILVQSLNGPSLTAIEGYQVPGTTYGTNAVRCAYLTNGALLAGFTLTNGAPQSLDNGGGVYCESPTAIVSNCVLIGNSVNGSGGGAWSGTFNNCIFAANSAFDGGGASGSTLNNCVLTNNAAVNFMSAGGGAHNCLLNNCVLGNNSAWYASGGAEACMLNYCTLTNNSGGSVGGGASRSTLNNCILKNNSVDDEGGGAMGSTLNNCILSDNFSWEEGGGAAECILNNCTIVQNSTGADCSTVNNCIVYYNQGGDGYSSTWNYCCTGTLPANGSCNFTNEPLFMDLAGGDVHLQFGSPCINAGNNSFITNSTDLGGNPRIKGGTVDIGAYEFQTPTSVISYAWLQQYGLPTDGSADFTDTDNDGMNNWQEWIAGTDPTNGLSVLQMLAPSNSLSGITVSWQSVTGRMYYLDAGVDLLQLPALSALQSNIVG